MLMWCCVVLCTYNINDHIICVSAIARSAAVADLRVHAFAFVMRLRYARCFAICARRVLIEIVITYRIPIYI